MTQNLIWTDQTGAVRVTYLDSLSNLKPPLTTQQYLSTKDMTEFPSEWTLVAQDVPLPTERIDALIWTNNTLAINPVVFINTLTISIIAGINSMIENLAMSWKYDSSLSLATYVTSPRQDWSNQAKTFVAWRDSVWTQVFSDNTAIATGTKSVPTDVASYLATLPQPPAMPTS